MQVLQVVTIMVLSIYLHDIIDRHTIASVFHTVSAIYGSNTIVLAIEYFTAVKFPDIRPIKLHC